MDDPTGEPTSQGDEPGSADRLPFVAFLLFEAALAPVALVAGWALGQHPLAGFAWDGGAVGAGLVAAVPMLAALFVALRWPVGPLRGIKAFFDRELAPALRGCGWPDLALISVTAGVAEEMLFRGVIQGGLARFLSPGAAVAAAGVVFGLLHPVSVAYVVIAGLLGAYLGLVWMATGNLLAAMVAHAVYDFVALVAVLRDRPGDAGD